ncbi:uncharacterized protein LOC119585598 [Penaeus monodon]|uniref:uncharacterized protein LOC119585598 n=1 Tax=Penaeus monodon TaxID=6687 RepID=UPI0018A78E1E|nr:uncharacterized protein LOC119585598 [Penaeus monodon]
MIQECYKDVRVKSTVGMTEHFEVKVGLHQGSALSPLLFTIVFDIITGNKFILCNTNWDISNSSNILGRVTVDMRPAEIKHSGAKLSNLISTVTQYERSNSGKTFSDHNTWIIMKYPQRT